MADLDDLQRRIAAALQRIDAGVDGLASGGADPAELDGLRAELEQERAKSAEMAARITELEQDAASAKAEAEDARAAVGAAEGEQAALKEAHAAELSEARSQSVGQAEAVAQVDAELQKLRSVSAQLRENNKALREANAAGLSEPHLINKSMVAELDALRAERAADVAETSAILTAMTPLIEQGESADA